MSEYANNMRAKVKAAKRTKQLTYTVDGLMELALCWHFALCHSDEASDRAESTLRAYAKRLVKEEK
jgi:hypothetical protein